MEYKPCRVIAEIGCSHLGSLERAKELCDLAKLAGADYVKTQKRNPLESTPSHMRDSPHPNPAYAYGKTYLEHRQALELPIEAHAELQKHCESIGIVYTTSVWDMTSADEVIRLNPPLIKVPSACNNHAEMIHRLFHDYHGEVHVSTGMTSEEEMQILETFARFYGKRMVIYHCTSAYPCPFDKLFLLQIPNLIKRFALTGARIGFSNHGKGIAADVAAYALGATWVERHFIDDRTIRHTDAAASLEPDGLRKLCRDLQAVHRAMTGKPDLMDDLEKEQRNKLKFRSE